MHDAQIILCKTHYMHTGNITLGLLTSTNSLN